jgi:hypothetical protein
MEDGAMTCLIACSRCKTGFDLDEAGAGRIYMSFPKRIPLCANCIDEIVYEYLEKEAEE